MDIARTPSTPDGNPEMADAAPEPKEPSLIRREDYQPFPWSVPQIALRFDLGIERTQVQSKLRVERNPASAPVDTIRLNGDGIESRDPQGYRLRDDTFFVIINAHDERVWVTSSTFAQLLEKYGSQVGLPGQDGEDANAVSIISGGGGGAAAGQLLTLSGAF